LGFWIFLNSLKSQIPFRVGSNPAIKSGNQIRQSNPAIKSGNQIRQSNPAIKSGKKTEVEKLSSGKIRPRSPAN
jgi:hypothetical protein